MGDLIKKLKSNFPNATVTGDTNKINDELKSANDQSLFSHLILFFIAIVCVGVTSYPDYNEIIENQYVSEKIKRLFFTIIYYYLVTILPIKLINLSDVNH